MSSSVLNDNIEPEMGYLDPLECMLEGTRTDMRAAPRDACALLAHVDALILAGEFASADEHAERVAALDPALSIGIARLRGEIRGMDARKAWFETGAAPSFPGGPTHADRAALALGEALRTGDALSVDAALDAMEAARDACPATLDDAPYPDLRDVDDRIPHALEAITAGGAYLWIDLSRVASATLAAPARPRHLAYVRARVVLMDGAQGHVLLPALYWDPAAPAVYKLGRETDWVAGPGRAVMGRGQRCILAGDQAWGFLAIRHIVAASA